MNQSAKYFEDDRSSKFADLPIMVGLVTKFVMPINRWTQFELKRLKTIKPKGGRKNAGCVRWFQWIGWQLSAKSPLSARLRF